MYWIVKGIVQALMRLLVKVHMEGGENGNANGPLIVVTNHLSRVDPPAVMIAVKRQMKVFAARKYRSHPFFFMLFEAVGVIWVKQAEADREALRAAVEHLKTGGALGMAPEGTRSMDTYALIRARSGISFIASRTGAAVLPVAVWGTENVIPQLKRFRRGEIWIRVGKPFRPGIPPHAKGEELERGTDEIMCALAALLPESYRGEYADHPFLLERLRAEGR